MLFSVYYIIFMKFGQQIYPSDVCAKFQIGSHGIKSQVNTQRGHIDSLILMKYDHNICLNDILSDFGTVSYGFKNQWVYLHIVSWQTQNPVPMEMEVRSVMSEEQPKTDFGFDNPLYDSVHQVRQSVHQYAIQCTLHNPDANSQLTYLKPFVT